MKPAPLIGILGIALVLFFCAGCTSSSQPSQPATATPVLTPYPTIATPVPTATLYPGTHALNQPVTFGTADKTGSLTVYGARIVPNYSWTDPTFNSVAEQTKAGDTLYSTQHGYNTQNPTAGNVFLFVYARLTNTGTASLGALSTGQITVNYDGKDYAYNPISGSRLTFTNGLGNPYNYDFQNGGVTGFVAPGSANAAEGFLIYEVPASIDVKKAAVVVKLDNGNQAAWGLV